MNDKPWYAAFGGRGPDWVIDLVVAPLCVSRLRAVVDGMSLTGFVRHEGPARKGIISDAVGDHLWFIDDQNEAVFGAHCDRATLDACPVCHFIAVEGAALRIERRGGGHDRDDPGVTTAAENDVLRAVLAESAVGLARWAVYAGGDGCEVQDVATGHTKDQLSRFLR